MDPDPRIVGGGTDEGGDAACWLDDVRDCCGTLVDEPHRAGCAAADDGADARLEAR
jgi:hypothetical protein